MPSGSKAVLPTMISTKPLPTSRIKAELADYEGRKPQPHPGNSPGGTGLCPFLAEPPWPLVCSRLA